jgi:pimeloyl-ACP methyl ester carboxylesterase
LALGQVHSAAADEGAGMAMKVLILSLVALVAQGNAASAQRSVPNTPQTACVKITFNRESINAYYLFIDARTEQERQRDNESGTLCGPPVVFFQGHAQRPSDAYAFTSSLARMSKSGIVIVPVCDTPYGKDDAWRGDAGKEVILMELVRWVLASRGIQVQGYSPLSADEVLIDGFPAGDRKGMVPASLLSVGWSHGGILARRFAHAYPGSVTGLAQVCPAGYKHWGTMKLALRFMGESLRLSRLTLKGHGKTVLRSAWGFTRGLAGDFFRSIPAAALDLQPARVCRVGRDMKDCTLYCDSDVMSVERLESIVVLFAADDTCMDVKKIMRCPDTEGITPEHEKIFWETFYRDEIRQDVKRTFTVLPGTHLAPVTHSALFARTVLEHLDQMNNL